MTKQKLTWEDIARIDELCMALKHDPKYAIELIGESRTFYERILCAFIKEKEKEK